MAYNIYSDVENAYQKVWYIDFILFQSPYSTNVKSNIGKIFMRLVDKHFLVTINKHSDHPPSVIDQIPSMISNRISENSYDINHFDKAAHDYKLLLKIVNLMIQRRHTYSKSISKRDIIWFNSPYSANVKINVGTIFMRLVDKHFPR